MKLGDCFRTSGRTATVTATAVVFALSAVAVSGCGTREAYSKLLKAQAGTPIAGGQAAPGSLSGVPSTDSGGIGASASGSPAGSTSGTAVTSGGAAGTAQSASGGGSGLSANGGRSGSIGAGQPTGSHSCSSPQPTIVIGSVGEQSGIAGAAVAAGPRAVAAWVSYINSQGGVACHPLKYVIADDGGSPSQNQALTEQLVDQDHVVAFVQNDAPLAAAGSEQFLASHNIPVIGSEGAEQFYYDHPDFFPESASGDALVYSVFAGLAQELTPSQKAHVGVLSCVEAAECSVYAQQGPADAQKLGLTLVYNGSGSLSAPNFTSQCQAAEQAGATALLVALDPNSIHRAASSCAGINFHPQLATAAQTTTPDMASDPNLNGLDTELGYVPWTAANIPSVALFQKVMSQYGAGIPLDGSSIQGWVTAQMFLAGASNLPPGNVTSAQILAGMDSIKNNDLGGITNPLTFTAGQNAPVGICWFEVKLVNGAFVSPNDGQRSCAP
jgi:branched-chain amino acid transport system substrate-binding protein